MSGYAVPQGSTPGSPRSGKSASALPVLELVGMGLAFLAFIIAFLPWAELSVPDGVDGDFSAQGWELPLPTVITTLLLVAALLVAARLLTRSTADADAAAASPVPALLALLAFVLAVVYVIIGGDYLGSGLERGIGTWLGLVLALGTAATLTLAWLQRSGRMAKPAASAGPSNWGGQSQSAQPQSAQPPSIQPQGWGQPQGYGTQPPQQPGYGQPSYGQPPQQPPAYGQGGAYGQPTGGGSTAAGSYGPGPATGNQPPAYGQADQPPAYGQAEQAPYGQPEQPPVYGQPDQTQQFPPATGGYPAQGGGGYHPQG